MSGYLRIEGIGNLGRDAEMKYPQSGGDGYLRFGVACSVYAGKDKDPETTWLSCTLFGKRAQSLQGVLTKGMKIFVSGRPSARGYTTRDGGTAASLDVIVNELQIVSSKGESSKGERQDAPDRSGDQGTGDPLEEMPF